jgi:photosystem II stability/assembly factor-like uncharacterized protein
MFSLKLWRGGTAPGYMIALVLLLALAACSPAGTGKGSASPTTIAGTPVPVATATPGLAAWIAVTNVPAAVIALRFAPFNPSVAYLCADDGPAAPPLTATSRLYKSTDGGQSWQRVTSAPTLQPVPSPVSPPASLAGCRVFVDAHDASDVLLQETEIEPVGASFAVARALWRSRDGGGTWQQLASVDRTDGFDDLAVLGTRLIARSHPSFYGASPCDPSATPKPISTMLGSDDGGMTWHDLGQGIESQRYSPHDFAIAGNVLFAAADKVPATACDSSPIVSALWRSTDGGTSWSKVSGTPTAAIGRLSFTPKASGAGYYGVAGAGTQSGGFMPLYSSDSGASWRALPSPDSASSAEDAQLAVAPSGAVLVGRYDDSVSVIRPGDPHPSWNLYVAGGSGHSVAWQIVTGPSGAVLWSVSFYYGGPYLVEHLPLP